MCEALQIVGFFGFCWVGLGLFPLRLSPASETAVIHMHDAGLILIGYID